MKRTLKRSRIDVMQVDAILCADIHLREDTPTCRIDVDFIETQFEKLLYIKDLQQKYQCPVLHSGDLFHNWKASPYLLSRIIQALPESFYTVYGNHDLPQHNIDLLLKSSINVLEVAEKLHVLSNGNWGVPVDPVLPSIIIKGRRVLVWHVFTYTGRTPWPGCTAPNAQRLLDEYTNFDLILTGDNHTPFIVEDDDRLLVNPGSLMRQAADQINYNPAVFLYNAEYNKVIPHYIPINPEAVTRQHIDHKEDRDGRIDAFISKLKSDWDSTLNFEENLRRFEETNNVRKSVMSIVYKSIQ